MSKKELVNESSDNRRDVSSNEVFFMLASIGKIFTLTYYKEKVINFIKRK